MFCVYCRVPLIAWAGSFGSLCYVAIKPCLEDKGRGRRDARSNKEIPITERAKPRGAETFGPEKRARLGWGRNREVVEMTYAEMRRVCVTMEAGYGSVTRVRYETETCCVCRISRWQIKSNV